MNDRFNNQIKMSNEDLQMYLIWVNQVGCFELDTFEVFMEKRTKYFLKTITYDIAEAKQMALSDWIYQEKIYRSKNGYT